MKLSIRKAILLNAILSLLLIAGCTSGGGKGGSAFSGTSSSNGTTTLTGKVTLSNTVQLSKTTRMKMEAGQNYVFGKPGSKSYSSGLKPVPGTSLNQTLFGGALNATQLTHATVDLYDASHPEWLYPVASTKTDDNGDYTLNALINSEYNKGATYENGGPIPAGLYTLVAYKVGVGLKPVVSVQAVVNRYDGLQSVDFEVVDSDIEPSVQTMFGVFKNSDGTETFGNEGLVRAMNGAIQISFSMPMWRDSLTGISISPAVEGNWSLSADWRTATFYLKQGVTLEPNTTYTVKVNGADTSNPVYNVYTNAIRKTVTGTFTTTAAPDTQSPTAQWKSPSLYDMGSSIDIITPLRIQVNKPLDVNGLYLDASPSVGDRTSVYFLGTEQDSKGNLLYIYEFGLGKSLKLNTTYTMAVKGGRDLAGNSLTLLNASISTKAASDYNAGIDAAADPATQELQAEIYDVFGKWVRSLNDRNMALFQSLMTGDFYMEYSTINGLDSADANHDGRYSLNEFSRMMLSSAFPQWEWCGANIWGEITPQTYITIGVLDPATGEIDMSMANLEFKLRSSTVVQNQQCSDISPSETFYMTLKKYNENSPWVVRRASVGLDNRNTIPSQPNLVKANLYAVSAGRETLVPDGGQLRANPMPSYAAKFKWDPIPGVQSLVLAVIDSRTNCTGFAAAYPNTVTELTINDNPAMIYDQSNWLVDMNQFIVNTQDDAVDVTSLFGLDGRRCNNSGLMMGMAPPPYFFQDGGEYYWEVIGFKSTPIADIAAKSSQTLIKDIGSISLLKRYSIAGLYRELTLYVSALGNDIGYNDVLRGYDAGSAGKVTITVYSPNVGGIGNLFLSGSASTNVTLNFDPTGKAEVVDLSLYQGVNYLWIDDGAGLFTSSMIFTKGGNAPPIWFNQVTDDIGALLDGGDWDFYTASSGAKHISIDGTFTPKAGCDLPTEMWYGLNNNQLGAYYSSSALVYAGGNFTMDNIEIYKGVNWIYISACNSCNCYQRQIGVSTDTGTLWTAPISVLSVKEATKTADYGQMSDWDASADLDNYIQASLKFKLCNGSEIPYIDINTWSDGGNNYYQYDPLSGFVDGQGNADFGMSIYHGLNNININTWYPSGDCDGGWYGLRINTTGGIPVVKTAITSINTIPYNNTGSATVAGCTATIKGTAEPGMVYVYWRGYNGTNSYSENNRRVVSDTANNEFTVTVPVVSGTGSYNVVDIYNRNWVSTSVSLYTTGNCSSYATPVLTVDPISYSGGNTVTISGTSNKAKQSITVYQSTCSGNYDFYSTTAATSPIGGPYNWSIPVTVYNGSNYFYVSDGYSNKQAFVSTSNGNFKLPGTRITSVVDASNPSITYTVPAPTSNCGGVTIDTGDSIAVTITGITNEPDGSRGFYSISNSPMGMSGGAKAVNFIGGGFEIQNVPVYGSPSPDNYLYMSNAYGDNILDDILVSSNSESLPKYVEITSHSQGGTVDPLTVVADIRDPEGSGWVPEYYEAIWINDSTQEQYYYSSNTDDQVMYGYLPITVETTGLPAGTIARVSYDIPQSASYGPSDIIELGVAGFNNTTGEMHVHVVWVNNTGGYPEMYWKPGAAAPGPKPHSAVFNTDSLIRKMVKKRADELRK